MCIHDKVSKLKSSTRVNAACLDLMRGKDAADDDSSAADAPSSLRLLGGKKGGKKSGCPYYDDNRRLDLRDMILAEVQDIEEVMSTTQLRRLGGLVFRRQPAWS